MSDEATVTIGGAGCGSVMLHGKNGVAMICVSMPESVACAAWSEVGVIALVGQRARGDRRVFHKKSENRKIYYLRYGRSDRGDGSEH